MTPYAHTKFKLHKLKHITLKIEVKGCNGLGVLANKWRIGITNVLKAIARKVMKWKLRIHLDCSNQLLNTKGRFKQYLGPNSMFWTLSSTSNTLKLFFTYFSTPFLFTALLLFILFFTNLSFLLVPYEWFWHTHTHKNHFPHTCFLPYINQKEFNLTHTLLCFKNKGMDGPKLG